VLPAQKEDFNGNIQDPFEEANAQQEQFPNAEENIEVKPLAHMMTSANFFPNGQAPPQLP